MSFWTSPTLQPLRQHRFRIVFTASKAMQKEFDKLRGNNIVEDSKKNQGDLSKKQGQAAQQNPETKDFWWWVKSCTLPSYEIAMSEYQLVNKKFKYPGMLVWNDVTMTMVDTSYTTELLHKMLISAGYSGANVCGDTGVSKQKFANQGDFRIQLLNANGSTKKSWLLAGWFIRSVKYGDVSYESDDMVQLDLQLGYDYAVLEQG